MENKLVSVIIPVYNAEVYLADMLGDVINQSYKNIEIIIIDDGSTDNSWNIIQEFAKEDNRIISIHSKNRGPSGARNLGIENSRGEYIRFLDADDRIPENSIKDMVTPFLCDNCVDLVIGNYVCSPEKSFFLGENIQNGYMQSDEFIDLFISNIRSYYIGVPWNKMYRTEIIKNNNIKFNECIMWCEDFLFNIEYYRVCTQIYLVSIPGGIYTYCLRGTGITSINKNNIKMIKYVDKIRYEQAKEYCKLYQKENEFELEWNYSDLYAKLSNIAKNPENESMKDCYYRFQQILIDKEAYKYICIKAVESGSYVWIILKWLIDKKKYKLTFAIFVLKAYMITNLKGITRIIRKKFLSVIPKHL